MKLDRRFVFGFVCLISVLGLMLSSFPRFATADIPLEQGSLTEQRLMAKPLSLNETTTLLQGNWSIVESIEPVEKTAMPVEESGSSR